MLCGIFVLSCQGNGGQGPSGDGDPQMGDADADSDSDGDNGALQDRDGDGIPDSDDDDDDGDGIVDSEDDDEDLDDDSLTENTRAAYPISHIPSATREGVAGHPSNIIMLTADAFGVLPPVARLDARQALYHFLSGYTAKVAGTERAAQRAFPTSDIKRRVFGHIELRSLVVIPHERGQSLDADFPVRLH